MSEEDPIQIIISIFKEAFETFELPACIGIVDNEGLSLVTTGECPDIDLFEGQLASLIDTFENIRNRFTASFSDDLELMILEFGNNTFYIDNLLNSTIDSKNTSQLYLVAQSVHGDLILNARPFLTSIVKKIELMFSIAQEGSEINSDRK
jgi:hypothetical protein